MKMPAEFRLQELPPVVKNNFRSDVHDTVMRMLYVAQFAVKEHDEGLFGFTVTDMRDNIFERAHRLNYLINKLEDLGLIEHKGYARLLQGTPKVYVITELYSETIGDVREFAKGGWIAGREAIDSDGVQSENSRYTTVFVNSYSGVNIHINKVMAVFAQQQVLTQKSRAVAGMLGFLGIEGEFGTEVIDPAKAKFWIDDYISYLENIVKILRQLEGSPYFRSHDGQKVRAEIWSPLLKDGSVHMTNVETGQTIEEFFEGLAHFISDAKTREVFGELSVDMANTVAGKLRSRLDTEEDL